VSAVSEAITALKDALKLVDDVKRAGETIKELAGEVRSHDRRITRLEAQWETALLLSQRTAGRAPTKRIDSGG
jgi:hypothetical protein